MRMLLKALWVVGLLAGALEARPPNVVIFYTDDQGALDVNSFGSSDLITPVMDRLSNEGTRFTQAYGHTVCCPARAALISGKHPQRVNMNRWSQGTLGSEAHRNLPLDEVTLAEALKSQGYKTALFGKWHLGGHPDHRPLKHGFDEFFGILVGYIDNYTHFGGHTRPMHDLWDGEEEVFRRGDYFPDMITDRATTFIARNQDEPFFLFLSFNLPHYPEQPVGEYADAYADMPEPRRSYARVVSTCDHYLGRIMGVLDQHGLTDDTIILFTADNGVSGEDYQNKVKNHPAGMPFGENYGANGGGGNTGKWIGEKNSFLEGGIRVPAILRYPAGVPAGAVRDQAVTTQDWYPTILDLAGLSEATPDDLDGRSAVPVIADAEASSAHDVLYWQWDQHWTVREGDWKLIHKGTYGFQRPALDEWHLANLTDEVPEKQNHAAEHPEIVERLKALHEAWAKDVFSEYGP